MANLVIILAGQTLPERAVSFKEITTPNESDNVTLDGTLYTDFVNTRRSWSLEWDSLSADEYDLIRAIYNNQYVTEAYPLLEIVYYGITAAVKVNITDKDIRWDGNCIKGFGITLLEQYAIS